VKPLILKCANLIGETGLYRILRPGRIPVFMLHRVTSGDVCQPGEITADQLRQHLSYLSRRGYQVLSMDDLLAILDLKEAVPSKSVMFTIDDGFFDQNDVAAAVFDEFGFPLNFFVITGLLDKELWPWDDQITYALNRTTVRQADFQFPSGKGCSIDLDNATTRQTIRGIRNVLKGEKQERIYEWLKAEFYKKLSVEFPNEIPKEFRPMSWEDARSLRKRGHGVFPHTCSHRILSTLSSEEKHYEIHQGQQRVALELGFNPEVFAYPTGRPTDYDSTDIDELKRAGFRIAFNTVPDYVRQGASQQYELPRFSLPQSGPAFLKIVNRLESFRFSNWHLHH
jgi:peptidoglycan/xylan/chitin deacetylase (PgdA/CDA1 family)